MIPPCMLIQRRRRQTRHPDDPTADAFAFSLRDAARRDHEHLALQPTQFPTQL
jgi:hypothetical protein